MITRSHQSDTSYSTAVYSDCETYRYSLTRVWQEDAPRVMFVMLNPSTADELQNDPTVERCEQRARRLGFGGFRVTNIFAFRATAPGDMKKAQDPVGTDNAHQLALGIEWADQVIAAWGVHGAHMDQGPRMGALLKDCGKPLFHLGLTKEGHPKHPLYLPYAQRPVAWTGASGR